MRFLDQDVIQIRTRFYDQFEMFKPEHQGRFWKTLWPGAPQPRTFYQPVSRPSPSQPVLSVGAGVSGMVRLKLSNQIKNAPIWVSGSNADKQALKMLVVDPEVIVIPFPLAFGLLRQTFASIGSPEWKRRKKAFLRSLGLQDGSPTFCFVGRIGSQKGLGHLIDLVERSRVHCQLIVAGFWEEHGDGETFRRALFGSRYCRVGQMGMLDRQKYLEVLSYADAVACLSTCGDEDFGFLPREALALGIPLLMTNWGGFRDIPLLCRSRRFIRSFEVKEKEDGSLAPSFRKFDLNDWLDFAISASVESRRSCSEDLIDGVFERVRSGLEELHQAMEKRKKLRSPSPPIELTRFSAELALRAIRQGYFNPTTDYPRRVQLKFMRGPCAFETN